MLELPPDKRQEPKTLFAARQEIAKLKSLLKAQTPVPKLPERPPNPELCASSSAKAFRGASLEGGFVFSFALND
jgi:hypothetical protein